MKMKKMREMKGSRWKTLESSLRQLASEGYKLVSRKSICECKCGSGRIEIIKEYPEHGVIYSLGGGSTYVDFTLVASAQYSDARCGEHEPTLEIQAYKPYDHVDKALRKLKSGWKRKHKKDVVEMLEFYHEQA
ncbi:MAG: hypothetical protein HZB68_01330 [Candidatus Aenigmarchaeota archaeon]|nr:hypothetical protein [Candidatus Aenigmarchaeota archaeon]